MGFQPSLQATPDVVIVDIEAGQISGTTKIEYSKERVHAIWRPAHERMRKPPLTIS